MRLALGLLPFISLLAVWMPVTARLRDWRTGFLVSFAVIAGLTLVVTEALSVLNSVRVIPVAVFWLLLGCIGIIALRQHGTLPPLPNQHDRSARAILAFLLLQFLVLLVLALSSVPNTFDSMTYHMTRVAHIVASGNLDVYPTNNTPQVYLWPLAEIGIAHLQLLSGGDRLANLIQLLAHVVSIVGVSVIARNLGLGHRYQLVAALIAATTPMAVAQAVTTQNDYVTASFLVCAVAFATEQRISARTWRWELLVSLALGLAIATKATAVLFGIPLAAWYALGRVKYSSQHLIRFGALAVASVLVLSAGQLTRNISTFGDPTGPDEPALRNAPISLESTAGNLVRNAGLNFGVPSAAINARVGEGLRALMEGAGIDPDDRSSIFAADSFFVDSARNEDAASSPGQWLLLLAVMFACLTSTKIRRKTGGLVLALAAGYLLFSLTLKWQPYGGRLLLPVLVLAAAPIAVMLSRTRWVLVSAGLVALVVASLPWLLLSQYRPLLGSTSVLSTDAREEYFAANISLREPFRRASAYVELLGVERVGLRSQLNDYEYPLWRLPEDPTSRRLVAVDVTSQTRDETRGIRPHVVICTSACPDITSGGLSRRFGPVTVEVDASFPSKPSSAY